MLVSLFELLIELLLQILLIIWLLLLLLNAVSISDVSLIVSVGLGGEDFLTPVDCWWLTRFWGVCFVASLGSRGPGGAGGTGGTGGTNVVDMVVVIFGGGGGGEGVCGAVSRWVDVVIVTADGIIDDVTGLGVFFTGWCVMLDFDDFLLLK